MKGIFSTWNPGRAFGMRIPPFFAYESLIDDIQPFARLMFVARAL
jgi:hypothetical protein